MINLVPLKHLVSYLREEACEGFFEYDRIVTDLMESLRETKI